MDYELFPKTVFFSAEIDKDLYQRFKGYLFRNGISGADLIYHVVRLAAMGDDKLKPVVDECKQFKLELMSRKVNSGNPEDMPKRLTVNELYRLLEEESPLGGKR